MIRRSYLEDVLTGSNSKLLEKGSIRKVFYFIVACEYFFEMDFSKPALQKENLAVIQRLLEAWFAIKQVFLDEEQLDSGEGIKQYYNCYQFHPYIDCFDLLTHDISLRLSELKMKDGQISIEHDDPLINKLIAFGQQYKADFLKKAKAYKRIDEERYKQVIDYYEQFKQLPFLAGRDKGIYYFSIYLKIPKCFLWAQLYYAIQQVYKCFNELFIKHNLLVVRTITVDAKELEVKFICMGFSYPSYRELVLLRESVFSSFPKYSVRLSDGIIKIPKGLSEIEKWLQPLALENSQQILTKLQALITETEESKIKATFQSIMTTDNIRQVNKLWAYLGHQHLVDEVAKDSIRGLLSTGGYRTSITGLYSFQVLNKKAISAMFKED